MKIVLAEKDEKENNYSVVFKCSAKEINASKELAREFFPICKEITKFLGGK